MLERFVSVIARRMPLCRDDIQLSSFLKMMSFGVRAETNRNASTSAAVSTIQRSIDITGVMPLPAPMNVYAAPANYHAHIEEMRQNDDAPRNSTRELGFFLKAPASISGPSDPIELPDRPGRRFDHEGELTFIIGKPARGVTRDRAMEYVWGYTCALDITMRVGLGRNEERSMRKIGRAHV